MKGVKFYVYVKAQLFELQETKTSPTFTETANLQTWFGFVALVVLHVSEFYLAPSADGIIQG